MNALDRQADGSPQRSEQLELLPIHADEEARTMIGAPDDIGKGEEEDGSSRSSDVVQAEVSDHQLRSCLPASQRQKEDSDTEHGVNLIPDAIGTFMAQNQFAMRKMAAKELIDVALMMATISQLRTILTAGDDLDYYNLLLSMVSFSLTAQIAFAVIIFIIYVRENEDKGREEFQADRRLRDPEANACNQFSREKTERQLQRRQMTNRLNYITVILVFFIMVINMFITGFGIKLRSSNGGPPTNIDASIFDLGVQANATVATAMVRTIGAPVRDGMVGLT